jgi:hypothetical protein
MFAEDLLAYLDTTEFASSATYKAATYPVIFDREFLNQIEVQTSAPTALGRKVDFAAVAQNDTIVIDGVTYRVAEFEHDPPGFIDWTLLKLQV